MLTELCCSRETVSRGENTRKFAQRYFLLRVTRANASLHAMNLISIAKWGVNNDLSTNSKRLYLSTRQLGTDHRYVCYIYIYGTDSVSVKRFAAVRWLVSRTASCIYFMSLQATNS